MQLNVRETTDPAVIIEFVEQLQTLHHEQEPRFYKPFDAVAILPEIVASFDQNQHYYIAYSKEHPVGFLWVVIKDAHEDAFMRVERRLHLEGIVVAKAHHRQGVAKQLLEFLDSLALELDIQMITLDYWEFNQLEQFYGRQGYQRYKNQLMKRV